MIDYNATATKTKNVFEIIDLDISSSILASNIMGWLAAKCGSTGRRFNSINDKWTASLTTHAVMINTEDSLDARQPLILWLFTIK